MNRQSSTFDSPVILVFNPSFKFLWMPSPGPLPCHLPKCMVQIPKYLLTNDVSVIICPTVYDTIQFGNNNIGSQGFIGMQIVPLTFAFMRLMLDFDGFIRSLPLYFLTLKPRKSKPSSICVIMVFSSDSSSPLILRNSSIKGLTLCLSISGERPRYNEIISIPDKMNFVRLLEVIIKEGLDTVKSHIGKRR